MTTYDPAHIAASQEPFDFHEFAPFNDAAIAVFRGDGVEVSEWEMHPDTDELLRRWRSGDCIEHGLELRDHLCRKSVEEGDRRDALGGVIVGVTLEEVNDPYRPDQRCATRVRPAAAASTLARPVSHHSKRSACRGSTTISLLTPKVYTILRVTH
jgi:hypothetical protein